MLQRTGPWTAQAALGDHHLPRMPAELKLVLLRRACGEDLAAIAEWASVAALCPRKDPGRTGDCSDAKQSGLLAALTSSLAGGIGERR
ncbi:MAG: hypothetical protein C0506_16065 [Anaerolinea sp.]|nr:hypothetical protein [Anaerolinea sp.]